MGFFNDELPGTEGANEIGARRLGRCLVEIGGFGGVDFLIGGPCRDNIKGGSGNDTIKGRGINDLLTGGSGDDGICGGELIRRAWAKAIRSFPEKALTVSRLKVEILCFRRLEHALMVMRTPQSTV